MKRDLLIGAAALLFSAQAAFAADAPAAAAAPAGNPPAASDASLSGKPHHEWTLEEARQKAHERADKLDKMTPQEWAEQQQKRHDWREKWHTMTPEQKEAYKKARHDKRQQEQAGSSGSAAPAATSSPAPASGGQ